MTKDDHARLRQYKAEVRKRIEAGEAPTEETGRQVAQEMAARGESLPAEVASQAGWAK